MDLKEISLLPPWEWPEDAADVFLKTMKNKSASETDREMAVQMAGDYTVINDDLADALLKVLLDPKESEDMRRLAALSFGPAFENADIAGFEDPEDILISEEKFHAIQATLKKLFDDETQPVDVRRGVLEASVRAPEEWHPQAVQDAYDSDDELWHLTAVFCMNYTDGFDQEILDSLKHEDSLVRYHAVCAAGNWQVDEAWSYVKNILETEEEDIDLLLAAIESAASIRPDEARELIQPFAESEDEDIADVAFNALGLAAALMEEGLDEDSEED